MQVYISACVYIQGSSMYLSGVSERKTGEREKKGNEGADLTAV